MGLIRAFYIFEQFSWNLTYPARPTITWAGLRCFRDPIRVHRIENRVPRIRENYHRVPKIRENRVPRIREIGSLQVHTGYLTFSLKKALISCSIHLHYAIHFTNNQCCQPFGFPANSDLFFVELRVFWRLAGCLFLGLF